MSVKTYQQQLEFDLNQCDGETSAEATSPSHTAVRIRRYFFKDCYSE